MFAPIQSPVCFYQTVPQNRVYQPNFMGFAAPQQMQSFPGGELESTETFSSDVTSSDQFIDIRSVLKSGGALYWMETK